MASALSCSRVALLLGISRERMAEMCDTGEVDHFVAPGGKLTLRRIPRSEVERLLELMKRERRADPADRAAPADPADPAAPAVATPDRGPRA